MYSQSFPMTISFNYISYPSACNAKHELLIWSQRYSEIPDILLPSVIWEWNFLELYGIWFTKHCFKYITRFCCLSSTSLLHDHFLFHVTADSANSTSLQKLVVASYNQALSLHSILSHKLIYFLTLHIRYSVLLFSIFPYCT